jgi:DNA-directed RNA polymerase subunit RPC12/RpoP
MRPIYLFSSKAFKKTALVVPSYKGAIKSTFKRIYLHLTPRKSEEIMRVSKDPNLRCLECGWKYNLDRISACPICGSDRSRLFLDDDPFMNPGYWIVSVALTIAIVRLSFWLLEI